jgi:mRNA interferase RelE/StbE
LARARYEIEISKRAAKALAKLSREARERVAKEIDQLSHDPRPPGCEKLGVSGAAYRIRVGEYRVVYDLADKIRLVKVTSVGHRKDIYRRLPRKS